MLLAILVGCVPEAPGTVEPSTYTTMCRGACAATDSGGCSAPVVEEIPMDQVAPVGFSGIQALASMEGPHQETLTWSDGGQVGLTLEFTADRPEVTLETVECDDGTHHELILDLAFAFRTEDGGFDEVWAIRTAMSVLGETGFHHDFDPGTLSGTFEHAPCEAPSCTGPTAFVTFGLRDDGTTGGNLHFYGTPDATGDAGSIDLGSANWGWGQ